MWTVVSVSIDRFIHYKWITRLLLTCRDNRTLKYPGHLTMPSVSRGLFRWLFHPAATLEDFADRLNPVWTVGLLLILSSVLSWRHAYMGSISCWCPSSFTTNMVTYSEMECWNKDVTYSVMSANNISDDIRLSKNYARWLPLPVLFSSPVIQTTKHCVTCLPWIQWNQFWQNRWTDERLWEFEYTGTWDSGTSDRTLCIQMVSSVWRLFTMEISHVTMVTSKGFIPG